MKVFISHQKADRSEAQKIANYLSACGIDVYFDEYDRALSWALIRNDPKGIVNAIKAGVKSSTHMLVIVSKNTMSSAWVPFEVGYGYDRLNIRALTLQGIEAAEIPDYIKVVPIIRDIYDIDQFARKEGNELLMETKGIIRKSGSNRHTLYNVMDDLIRD